MQGVGQRGFGPARKEHELLATKAGQGRVQVDHQCRAAALATRAGCGCVQATKVDQAAVATNARRGRVQATKVSFEVHLLMKQHFTFDSALNIFFILSKLQS